MEKGFHFPMEDLSEEAKDLLVHRANSLGCHEVPGVITGVINLGDLKMPGAKLRLNLLIDEGVVSGVGVKSVKLKGLSSFDLRREIVHKNQEEEAKKLLEAVRALINACHANKTIELPKIEDPSSDIIEALDGIPEGKYVKFSIMGGEVELDPNLNNFREGDGLSKVVRVSMGGKDIFLAFNIAEGKMKDATTFLRVSGNGSEKELKALSKENIPRVVEFMAKLLQLYKVRKEMRDEARRTILEIIERIRKLGEKAELDDFVSGFGLPEDK